MKIFDCTTFFEEHLMMELRFNILNKYVEKFIVVESRFSHSGKEKKLNFDINKYEKFKDKIIYLVIDDEPKDLIEIKNDNTDSAAKRLNSIKRLEQSYDYIKFGLKDANQEDVILLSDNDEIPNLSKCDLNTIGNKIYIFEQKMFNYKFNLFYDLIPWYGSRACKFKTIKSFPWLKNLKNKKYPFWRFDVFFNKLKSMNIEIIKNGGWHFNNLMSPEDISKKLKTYAHIEYSNDEYSAVSVIKKKIIQKIDLFNRGEKYETVEIDSSFPQYLVENIEQYSDYIL